MPNNKFPIKDFASLGMDIGGTVYETKIQEKIFEKYKRDIDALYDEEVKKAKATAKEELRIFKEKETDKSKIAQKQAEIRDNLSKELDKKREKRQEEYSAKEKQSIEVAAETYKKHFENLTLEEKISLDTRLKNLEEQRQEALQVEATYLEGKSKLTDKEIAKYDEIQEKITQSKNAVDTLNRSLEQNEDIQKRVEKQEQRQAEDKKKTADRVLSRMLDSDDRLSWKTQDLKEDVQDKEDNLKRAFEDALERNDGDVLAAQNDPEVLTAKAQLTVSQKALSQNEKATKALSNIQDSLRSAFKDIEKYMSTYAQYQGKIDARLQGSGKTYDDVAKMITKNLALNPYVKQTAMLENISKLSEAGIAYNLEERAFLATITDKIATTFDATNTTLTRLIKLQQSDTTAERIGMEAYLTQFLNGLYGDTSYLNNLSKSVSEGIIDANSQLSKSEAFGFEYTVQKWLGALSSAGMSDATVQNLAKGINYIATGNITGMTGDTGLNTLFALAAGNANLDYGKLFSEPLSASTTNKLLEEIVKYLAERDKESKIVKGAYSDIFNMSVSDIKAVTNVLSNVGAISGSNLNLSQSKSELVNQISQISNRMAMSEKLENIWENWQFATGVDIASNVFEYLTWKVTNLLDETVEGIPVPSVFAAGFGVDLKTSISDILKLGMVGLSTIGQVMNLASAISSGGTLNLNSWGGKTSWSGGMSSSGGVSSGTSATAYVGSGSGSDIYKSSVSGQTEFAEESSKITNANVKKEDDYTASDIYKQLFKEQKPIKVEIANDDHNPMKVNWVKVDGSAEVLMNELMRIISQSSGSGSGIENKEELNRVINQVYKILDNNPYNQTAFPVKISTTQVSGINLKDRP